MTDRETQTRQILQFMQEGNAITDAVARQRFDCSRLGARIWDLRYAGVPIGDAWEYRLDKDGKVVKKWKKYFITRQ